MNTHKLCDIILLKPENLEVLEPRDFYLIVNGFG